MGDAWRAIGMGVALTLAMVVAAHADPVIVWQNGFESALDSL